MSSRALKNLLSLVAGLAFGVLASASHSAMLHEIVATLEPIGTLWVNAIRMTVIPLVTSLLIATIAEESDLSAVGRLGVRAVGMFVAILSSIAIFTFIVAPPLFSFMHVDPAGAASLRAATNAAQTPTLPTFASWLIGLVPPNPVRAAADGAMLPLIVFSVAFAAALARIDRHKRDATAMFFRALSGAMLTIVGWVLAAAPVGVFCLAIALAEHIGAGVAGAVALYLAIHSGILVASTIALYVMVRVATKVPLKSFARALVPAQVVAFTTRSSVAALPAMIEGASGVLKLPLEITGFALPFGVSVFRANQAVTWIVSALFVSNLYGVPLGEAQLALLGALSVAMSFSIPGIPSGGLFIIAPFFVSVGLPMEGTAILIALDAIPDIFKTLLNVTSQMAVTVVLS